MKNHLPKSLQLVAMIWLLFAGTTLSAQIFVTLEQPNVSGITWDIGSTRLISWNTNLTQPVKIELVDYSTLTPTVTQIVASTPNSTYSWFIDPLVFSPGNQYRIRVTSTVNPAHTDESDNDFALLTSLPGTSITVLQPSIPSIQVVKGTDYLISWNPVNVFSNVKIELIDLLNNTTSTIAASVQSSTFTWSVSNTLPAHNQYRIRVSSVVDPTVFDESDNNFEILDYPQGTITVLQPNVSGIKWVRGSQYLISWIDNIPDPVDIDLIRTANFWIAQDNTSGGTFNTGNNTGCNFNPWTITTNTDPGGFAIANKANPSAAGITGMNATAYRIVAYSDPGNDNNYVYADRTFGPYATPNGFTFSFQWGFNQGSGNAATGEKGFIVYTGGIGGTPLFTVVNDNNNSSIEINGSPMFNNAGLNAMTINFEYDAVASTVRVYGLGRDGVENYDVTSSVSGAPDAIRFFNRGQENDGTSVNDHALYFDNFFIRTNRLTIATGVGGSTWTWTVPTCIQTGNNYRIEVLGNGRTLADASDNGFQISATHGGTYITVLQPNVTGITWLRGHAYLISWIDDVVEPVRIRLLDNLGNVVSTLANNVPGSTWVWNIPVSLPLGQYRIRIDAAGIQDDSDHLFTVADYLPGGSITVQQPNVSGIKWIRGNSYLISWYPDGISGPFTIELWKGGVFHSNLASSVNGSTWVWTIPTGPSVPVGNDYRIRITANSGAVSDMSDNDFEVVDTPGGTITVLQPNGGETLYRGVGFWIAWIDDIPENVNVDLMEYDNSNTLQNTYAIFTNVTGSAYPWIVPLTVPTGNYFRVRVSSVVNPSINDESDAYFTITDLPLTFNIQPNPAISKAKVQFDEPLSGIVHLQITNRMNLKLFEQTYNLNNASQLNLPIEGLKSGIYFVVITANNKRMTQKLIIQ